MIEIASLKVFVLYSILSCVTPKCIYIQVSSKTAADTQLRTQEDTENHSFR